MPVDQKTVGIVEAVSFDKGYPVLHLDNGVSVPVSDLLQVDSPPITNQVSTRGKKVQEALGWFCGQCTQEYRAFVPEGEALGVVGDNIANVNTVGFKGQRVVFHDVLGHSILAGTASALPGSGVRVGDIQQMFTQGSLANTGIATDLALNGDGFFVVQGDVSGVSGNFYTRAGQFVINNDGFLVDTGGLKVQGYAADGNGGYAAAVSSMQVPTAALSPQATENIEITANLASSETVPTLPWDAQDPSNTSNFQSSITVYDSLGAAHTLEVYFRKTAANTWDYHVLADGDELNPPQAGLNVEVGTGSLTFTTNGELQQVTTTTAISASFDGATANQAIALDFGTAIAAGGDWIGWRDPVRLPFERVGSSTGRLLVRRLRRCRRGRPRCRHGSLLERRKAGDRSAGDCEVPFQ